MWWLISRGTVRMTALINCQSVPLIIKFYCNFKQQLCAQQQANGVAIILVIIWIYDPRQFLTNFLIYLDCSHTESHCFSYKIWLLVSLLISLALTSLTEGKLYNLKALIFSNWMRNLNLKIWKKGDMKWSRLIAFSTDYQEHEGLLKA